MYAPITVAECVVGDKRSKNRAVAGFGVGHIRVVAGGERIRLDAAGDPGVNMERLPVAGRDAAAESVVPYGVAAAAAGAAVAVVAADVVAGTGP